MRSKLTKEKRRDALSVVMVIVVVVVVSSSGEVKLKW